MAKSPNTPNGSAAMTAKRQREADEARGPDYRVDEIADFRNMGTPPDPTDPAAFVWLARVAMRAVEGAATDPGLRPEAAREQLVRLIPQAVKALDPARLGARITALESALAELTETKPDATDEPSRKASGARASASLS